MTNQNVKILIVGLGNPGLKYKKTRHNVGFMAIDSFKKENEFPAFKAKKQFRAEISEKNGVVLVKPQTFMNSSGLSALALSTYYLLPTTNFFIVHDDFDLPLGEIKVSQSSGAGGHHGVQSIIDNLKTNSFKRIRVGIKPMFAGLDSTKLKAEDFVLKKFTKEEQPLLQKALKKTCQQLIELVGKT
ncbi:aminoacyl-tRNA hydrolase [Candidatus Parcubacteria bacterium]|nr:aminoacyl-tRNA hydrolase [Candidatus Parcubacteria bacterium]